jgi:hypothetical protein
MTNDALIHLISRVPRVAVVMALSGCWTAPVATVHPNGEPRLIQGAIAVQSVQESAVVASMDGGAGTIVLRTQGRAQTSTYKVGPQVSGLNDIKAGDVVRATVAEDLAVYVLRDGELPGQGPIAVDARVLAVDPSYRLLRLQYPDGRSETFKVPLGTRLEQMAAGDAVVIQPVAVLAVRRKG